MTVKDYLVQGGKIFQTLPEWARFSQGGQRKRQKIWNVNPKNFHENVVPLPTYLRDHTGGGAGAGGALAPPPPNFFGW